MTEQQEANNFVLDHGAEKAGRIVNTTHPYYSEKSGSYYKTHKSGTVSIQHLRRSLVEYQNIQDMKKVLRTQVAMFRGFGGCYAQQGG